MELQQRLADYRAGRPPAAPAGRTGRTRRGLLAAGLAAAVLLGGAAAALRTQDPAPPPAAPAGAAAPEDLDQRAGGLPAPPGAGFAWRQWESPGIIATWLPSSPAAGPADPAGPVPDGFARTPAGALAAAAHMYPLIYYTRDRGDWEALADRRVLWAPGQREQLAAALDEVWDVRSDVPVAFTPVGYREVAASADRAVYRIWWEWDGRDGWPARVGGALVEVRWDGGDWKLWFDEPAMDMRPARPGETWARFGPRESA